VNDVQQEAQLLFFLVARDNDGMVEGANSIADAEILSRNQSAL
jgi:hypothetical protein